MNGLMFNGRKCVVSISTSINVGIMCDVAVYMHMWSGTTLALENLHSLWGYRGYERRMSPE